MSRMIVPVVAVGFIARVAAGDMIYFGQTRTVAAHAVGLGQYGVSQMLSSPDFSPFDGVVDVTANDPPPWGRCRGRATQVSTLDPRLISMAGTIHGEDNFGSFGTGSGGGTSELAVSFVVDNAEPYTFLALAPYWGGSVPHWSIRLDGPEGVVFSAGGWTVPPTRYEYDGVFSVGIYSLDLVWETSAAGYGTSWADARYDVSLMIPAPAGACAGIFAACLVPRRRRTRI